VLSCREVSKAEGEGSHLATAEERAGAA